MGWGGNNNAILIAFPTTVKLHGGNEWTE
jgi:hypothetical protein